MTEHAYIVGAGAVTSIGMSLNATSAAVRSELDAFASYKRFPAKRDGRPLKLALLPTQDATQTTSDRMLAMGIQAAEECLAQCYFDTKDKTPIPVFISVPPERPGFSVAQGGELAAHLMARIPCQCDQARSSFIATGQHGGLALLQDAIDLIAAGQANVCLVGGVDSYDSPFLDWLDAHHRLLADDTPQAMIPGEGAAFVMVASAAFLTAQGLTPTTVLFAATQGEEQFTWNTGKPGAGKGLSNALVPLLKDANRVAQVTYCDHNGEAWRSDEWTVAYLRTGANHGSPLDLRHPADCWGDIGAASGPMLMALAHHDLSHAAPDEPQTALVFCASDMTPYRAAAYLEKIGSPQKEANS